MLLITLVAACIERSCYPSPLNYYQFPKSVCTSVNEVICHGIPDYYEVKDGDIVNIDVTTYVGGENRHTTARRSPMSNLT